MLSLPSMVMGLSAKKSLSQITFKRDSNVSRVSFPEEDGLQLRLDRWIIPVFTEDVRRVLSTAHVVEACDACSNCFLGAMVGECVVTLVELGMGDGCGVDYRFIVSKHHGMSINGYSKISKGHVEVDDLIRAGLGCDVL